MKMKTKNRIPALPRAFLGALLALSVILPALAAADVLADGSDTNAAPVSETFVYPFPGAEQLYFKVPSLDDRLTVDGRMAKLFAPHVTEYKGWYDVNKVWGHTSDTDDKFLCWAASCANVITWYLDVCEKTGVYDVSGQERDVEKIFKRFKVNFNDTGLDAVFGMSWYFTGKFPSGDGPVDEIEIFPSGGYLKDVIPYCNNGGWHMMSAACFRYFGNAQEKYPFLEDLNNSFYPSDPFYNHRSFSENIIRGLHYGPAVLTVNKEHGGGAVSHAVTLWGCEYDTETMLVKKVYMADSDDEEHFKPGQALKPIKIRARVPDKEGIEMDGYYLGSDPLVKITGAMFLYSPEVLRKK